MCGDVRRCAEICPSYPRSPRAHVHVSIYPPTYPSIHPPTAQELARVVTVERISYSDPITKFVEDLLVRADFDAAQAIR